MEERENLPSLLTTNEYAHDLYMTLPYNVQRDLINNKDQINSMKDFYNLIIKVSNDIQ